MSGSTDPQPAHIAVDLPEYGDLCSILIPEIQNNSATEWRVIWSANETLCDGYAAAHYDVCELEEELAEPYRSIFPNCSTAKWTAPATIKVPAVSTVDYYPRPRPSTMLEYLLFLLFLAMVAMIGLFFFVALPSLLCFEAWREKGDGEEEKEEVAAPPEYQAKEDIETGSIEKEH
ncbi:hypothetical protein F5Y10DRAFT_267356 [Nemania abortiva]|nr:hypothetical protein F5Y10DRAFT_267356 [Nemania abortiva]